jgi:hypothetical protein
MSLDAVWDRLFFMCPEFIFMFQLHDEQKKDTDTVYQVCKGS